MKKQYVTGLTGLGDLVRTLSYVISIAQEQTHYQFLYHRSKPIVIDLFDDIIAQFDVPSYFSYSIVMADNQRIVEAKADPETITLATSYHLPHRYIRFKKQWQPNEDGTIAIYLNHPHVKAHSPENQAKFLTLAQTYSLRTLADRNPQIYQTIGLPRSFNESVDIMSKCRYVVGIEGGWTHVAHAMNVPYYAVRNRWDIESINTIHQYHPTLEIIETSDIPTYL